MNVTKINNLNWEFDKEEVQLADEAYSFNEETILKYLLGQTIDKLQEVRDLIKKNGHFRERLDEYRFILNHYNLNSETDFNNWKKSTLAKASGIFPENESCKEPLGVKEEPVVKKRRKKPTSKKQKNGSIEMSFIVARDGTIMPKKSSKGLNYPRLVTPKTKTVPIGKSLNMPTVLTPCAEFSQKEQISKTHTNKSIVSKIKNSI